MQRLRVWAVTQYLLPLLLCTVEINAYATGANPVACNDPEMKPNHLAAAGLIRDNTGMFDLQVQPTEYDPTNPDSAVSVRLVSSIGTKFKGFLIQARGVNSSSQLAQGLMQGPPFYTSPVCGSKGNGMTHTESFSGASHDDVSVSWTPLTDVCDSIHLGDLHFQATVVTAYTDAPQILIFSPVIRMKNIGADVLRQCKEMEQGANTTAKPSTQKVTDSTTLKIDSATNGADGAVDLSIALCIAMSLVVHWCIHLH